MYGYIYKTTNILNGKIYVGQHRSESFDETYYGSGKLIIEAIEKYGKNNFNCEIIEECNSEEELNIKEIFYIKTLTSKVTDGNYNISDGGFVPRLSGELNGNYGKHRPHTEEEKKHLSEIGKGHPPTGPKQHSLETKIKMSEKQKQQKHSKNRDLKVSNHHKNSEMLTNGVEQHWFYGEDVELMKLNGWYKGSCKPRKTKSRTQKTLDANKALKERLSNTIWVHRGIEKHQIQKDKLDEFLELGFSLGMKD